MSLVPTKPKIVRKRIALYGTRGKLVRVFDLTEDGVRKFVVQWGSKSNRKQQSFVGTPTGRKDALKFAEGFTEEAAKPATAAHEPMTTAQAFKAFMLASPHLRESTRGKYTQMWGYWEQWFQPGTPVDAMTPETPHQFRARMEAAGLASVTMHKIITLVRSVYSYLEATERIHRNRWRQYRFKVAKEKRAQPRAEYREHEFLAIWRQFDPTKASQWRAYVAVGLLGIYGARQTAVLHIKDPDDVDDRAGTLTLRPEWDKQGETHVLPLLPLTRELIGVSRAWRERDGYTGPYLLPPRTNAKSDNETYTIQSLWWSIKQAQQRAKIPNIKWRAGHGFRRGLVGDLLEAGNDMELALKAIGDRDLSMAKHYAIKRNDRIDRALAARVDRFNEGATKVQPSRKTAPKAKAPARTDASVTAEISTT